MYKELNSSHVLKEEIKANPGLIVYFYSNKCAPCVSLRPKVEQLIGEKFPELKLFFVNSEKNPSIPAEYSAFSSPTIILFFDGKEYRRESKYISIPQLAQTIARPYDMIFK